MAGTSGCIPDYHVNFFGQLCKPASRLPRITPPEPEPQLDFEQKFHNAPVPSRTADHASAPDPVAEMFKEDQHLIRGLSCGNVETYVATIKDVFAAVRQSRTNACIEMPTEQRLFEGHQAEQNDQNQAECPDQHQISNGDQHQHEIEHKHQLTEQCQTQQACHCQEHLTLQREDQEQEQEQDQSQPQSHNPPQHPAHSFVITHYPKTKDNAKLPRQAISPRSFTAGRRYHALHAIQ